MGPACLLWTPNLLDIITKIGGEDYLPLPVLSDQRLGFLSLGVELLPVVASGIDGPGWGSRITALDSDMHHTKDFSYQSSQRSNARSWPFHTQIPNNQGYSDTLLDLKKFFSSCDCLNDLGGRALSRLNLAPEILELLFSPKRIAEAKAFFFIFSRRWNMPGIKYYDTHLWRWS